MANNLVGFISHAHFSHAFMHSCPSGDACSAISVSSQASQTAATAKNCGVCICSYMNEIGKLAGILLMPVPSMLESSP